MLTWMDGLFRCPRFEVVCWGSCPSIIVWGLIKRNASITTFPLTLWLGSTTTATAHWLRASKLCTNHTSFIISLTKNCEKSCLQISRRIRMFKESLLLMVLFYIKCWVTWRWLASAKWLLELVALNIGVWYYS